jgi:O-antigen ligase
MGSGAIVMSAIILAMVLVVVAIMLGPQFIAASWLIGSPTVFGFPNQILRPLPFITMERLLLVMLIAMVFLKYAFTKKKTAWLPLEITIIVFLTYALISLSLHTNRVMLSQDGWLWIQYLLPMASFIISRRIEWSDTGLRALLALLTITGIFVASIGILQSQFGIHVFTMNYQTITSGHVTRAYGTFSSAHTYVATLFIFLTVTLLQFNLYKDALMRFVLLAAMAVITVGIVLGETRAPWLGAALGFIIIFVKHPQARPLMLLGGLAGLIIGMGVFIVMIDHLDSFISRVTNLGTLAGRIATWATAINMISDQPVFGVGFGDAAFELHKPDYITGIGNLTAQYAVYLGVPHNEYLHITVMLGVAGLILFLMILIQLVKLMFQIFNTTGISHLKRHLALYTGAIIIGLMFNSLFSDTYIQDYFWVLAYFLAGIAVGGDPFVSKHPVKLHHTGIIHERANGDS